MRLRSAGIAIVALLALGCHAHQAGGGGSDLSMPATGGGDLAGTPPGADLAPSGDLMTSPAPDMGPLPYDWPQFGFDAQHSGFNPRETTITAANVATLTLKAQVSFPKLANENGSLVDGAPVYLSDVTTKNGTQDLVFVTTSAGDLYALDAVTLQTVWMKSHGFGGACTNSHGVPCYTTAMPALDPNRKFVYSYGLDGKVHKHAAGDGTETTTGGWPALVTTKPTVEKGGSNLAVASTRTGDFLYSGVGGYYGDAGDYQGHVTAIKLADGSQKVFNTLCSNQTVHFLENKAPDCMPIPTSQSAVWARSGVVYRPDNDRIYFSTGNGTWDGMTLWGDSVLMVNADGSGTATGPLDAWTPADQGMLNSADADVGSTAPAFLPVPAGSKYKHIALQGNKVPSGKTAAPMRILDLDDLSGMGGPGHLGGELFAVDVPQGNEILTQPAVWVSPTNGATWVFVANDSGISGLELVPDGGSGKPSLTKVWSSTVGGSSPIVANGLVFYVSDDSGSGGTNQVYALDPLGNGAAAKVLWKADLKALTGAAVVGGVHWEGVIVAHGRVYVTSESGNSMAGTADGKGYLSMFALP